MADPRQRPDVPEVHPNELEHRRVLAKRVNAALMQDGSNGMTQPLPLARFGASTIPDASLWPGAFASIDDAPAFSTGLDWARLATQALRDVRSYGAVGDGLSDDTAAVQAALDDATVGAGAPVWFPEGVYRVSGLVVAQAGTQVLWNARARLVLADGSDAPLVTVSAAGVILAGERAAPDLVNMAGNAAQQSAGMAPLIRANPGSHDLVVQDLHLDDAEDRGIFVLDSDRATVRRCRIARTGRMGVQGLAQGGATLRDFGVVDTFIDRSANAAYSDGCIEVTANVNGTVLRPKVARNTCLMHPSPTGSAVVVIEFFGDPNVYGSLRDGRIAKNHVEGGAIGISVASRSASVAVGLNTVRNQDSIGIELVNCQSCVAGTNTVDGEGNTTTGIVVDGNSTHETLHNVVVGNTVRNCVDQSLYAIGSNAKQITFNGNTVLATNASGTGIRLEGVGGRVTLMGNTLDGGGTGVQGILIRNSSNVLAIGNPITGWALRPIQIVANGEAHGSMFLALNDLSGNSNNQIQFLEQNGGTLDDIFGWPNLPSLIPARNSQPSMNPKDVGFSFFNTASGQPEWWDGSSFVDAQGNPA